MKLFRILLLPLLIAGCEVKVAESPAKTHKCDLTQLENVKKYMDVCKGNGYLNDYCFDRGIESFCTLDEAKK